MRVLKFLDVCTSGFCNVLFCVYVWVSNVWLCVCVVFVICVFRCGFCNVWVCVCEEFVICCRVYVWVL